MHEVGFVRYSETPFLLKSGIESNVYVFGRQDLTDNPRMTWLVGEKLADLVMNSKYEEDKQVCLLGIPTAGTPFAQAASMASYCDHTKQPGGHPICFRIMKEALKNHGATKGWINGEPRNDQSYWLIDNVATNGASKPEFRKKMRADGYPDPHGVLIWIDRQQGALEFLRETGFKNVVVAYHLLDITYAFGKLGFWPEAAVKAVETEIELHQFRA